MKNQRKRDAERERNVENSLRQIGRIRERSRADGAALLVVLIPDENQINPQLQQALWGDADRSAYDLDSRKPCWPRSCARAASTCWTRWPASAATERHSTTASHGSRRVERR